jgi:two-component system nitrogen regulation response regulator GlnG
MIETALRYSGGHRQDAAKLLGWGRNTLTRKIKEHGMYEYTEGATAVSVT